MGYRVHRGPNLGPSQKQLYPHRRQETEATLVLVEQAERASGRARSGRISFFTASDPALTGASPFARDGTQQRRAAATRATVEGGRRRSLGLAVVDCELQAVGKACYSFVICFCGFNRNYRISNSSIPLEVCLVGVIKLRPHF